MATPVRKSMRTRKSKRPASPSEDEERRKKKASLVGFKYIVDEELTKFRAIDLLSKIKPILPVLSAGFCQVDKYIIIYICI